MPPSNSKILFHYSYKLIIKWKFYSPTICGWYCWSWGKNILNKTFKHCCCARRTFRVEPQKMRFWFHEIFFSISKWRKFNSKLTNGLWPLSLQRLTKIFLLDLRMSSISLAMAVQANLFRAHVYSWSIEYPQVPLSLGLI